MKLVTKAKYYITKGFKEPDLVRNYLRLKIKQPLLLLLTLREKSRLPLQKDLLDDFRKNENYLIIVLDACRYDALNEIGDEYFDAEIEPVYGTARNTFMWAKNAWEKEKYDVRYLSGAAPINSNLTDSSDVRLQALYDGFVPSRHLDIRDVWNEIWEEGEIPPEEMTEIALEENKDRMVVHYYQPHAPFVGELKTEDVLDEELKKDHDLDERMWNRAESGEITDDELWDLYVSNLRRAMESVKELVEKTDYENVVITADHGEALGEYGVYGHPKHIDHPKVTVVPWMRLK